MRIGNVAYFGSGREIASGGGRVTVTPTGQVTAESIPDPDWPKWEDSLRYSFGDYGNNLSTTPVFNEFKGVVATDSMFFAYGGGGRWGMHLFEGYGAENDKRVTILAGKHEGYADLYYYKPDGTDNDSRYHFVRIGCDQAGNGVAINHNLAESYVTWQQTPQNFLRQRDKNRAIEMTAGTTFGSNNRSGATIVMYGGEHSQQGSMSLWFGTHEVENTGRFRLYHMSPGGSNNVFEVNSQGQVILAGPMRLARLSSAPSSPANGQMYYDANDNTVKVYADGSWKSLAFDL